MKKFAAIAVAASMFALAACGEKAADDAATTEAPAADAVAEDGAAATAEGADAATAAAAPAADAAAAPAEEKK